MYSFRKNTRKPIGMLYTINNERNNIVNITNNSINNIVNNDKPDMAWGAHYWYFFHTLTEKIIDDKFNSKKDELINIIQMICSNLPCPECTEHAKDYINKVDWKNVKSKMDLKHIMYTFHNNVNSQKNYPIFSLDELETKYKSANTIAIINNFLNYFPYKGRQLMIGTHSHKVSSNFVRNWLKLNIDCFEK